MEEYHVKCVFAHQIRFNGQIKQKREILVCFIYPFPFYVKSIDAVCSLTWTVM